MTINIDEWEKQNIESLIATIESDGGDAPRDCTMIQGFALLARVIQENTDQLREMDMQLWQLINK